MLWGEDLKNLYPKRNMFLPAGILEGSVLESALFNPGSAKEGVSDIANLADHEIYLGYSNLELTVKSWMRFS